MPQEKLQNKHIAKIKNENKYTCMIQGTVISEMSVQPLAHFKSLAIVCHLSLSHTWVIEALGLFGSSQLHIPC